MSVRECLIFVVLSLLFCSCSFTNKSAIQLEAEKGAQKWFDASVAKCGEFYYLKKKWVDIDNISEKDISPEIALFQFKPTTFYLKENPITEATKLNGVEWQGSIVIPATAHRIYNYKTQKWYGWFDGTPKYKSEFLQDNSAPILGNGFNKKDSLWSINEEGKDINSDFFIPKIDCSEIPK